MAAPTPAPTVTRHRDFTVDHFKPDSAERKLFQALQDAVGADMLQELGVLLQTTLTDSLWECAQFLMICNVFRDFEIDQSGLPRVYSDALGKTMQGAPSWHRVLSWLLCYNRIYTFRFYSCMIPRVTVSDVLKCDRVVCAIERNRKIAFDVPGNLATLQLVPSTVSEAVRSAQRYSEPLYQTMAKSAAEIEAAQAPMKAKIALAVAKIAPQAEPTKPQSKSPAPQAEIPSKPLPTSSAPPLDIPPQPAPNVSSKREREGQPEEGADDGAKRLKTSDTTNAGTVDPIERAPEVMSKDDAEEALRQHRAAITDDYFPDDPTSTTSDTKRNPRLEDIVDIIRILEIQSYIVRPNQAEKYHSCRPWIFKNLRELLDLPHDGTYDSTRGHVKWGLKGRTIQAMHSLAMLLRAVVQRSMEDRDTCIALYVQLCLLIGQPPEKYWGREVTERCAG